MSALRPFLLVLSCIVSWSALAARPFVTDDAQIVDQGHCQLETFYKKQHAYSGSEFWFLPACNPSFVPLENGLEITVGEGHPAHDLGISEVAARAAHFPEPLVGLGPDLLEVLEQLALQRPGRVLLGDSALARLVQ